eukprot:UN00426
MSPLLFYYTTIRAIPLRIGRDKKSTTIAKIEKGWEVELLEVKDNRARVKICRKPKKSGNKCGWCSKNALRPKYGRKLCYSCKSIFRSFYPDSET